MELLILIIVMVSLSSFGAASDCGRITNTSENSGIITSPVNTSNKSCLWHIVVSPRYTSLQLKFHDLALRGDCTNCSCDSIEVWRSRTKDPKHWMGRFCGDDLKEKSLDSKESNHFLVEFKSTSWSGMRSNHTFLSYQGFEVAICIFPEYGCGKITNKSLDHGTITSPVVTSYKTCQWHIQVSPRMTDVTLTLHDLVLRDCPKCACDSIEVWSSRTKDRKHWIGKYCGSLKGKYISVRGNHVLIEFKSTSKSGMKSNHTFLSYQGNQIIACFIPGNGIHTGGPGIFVVTAIGILCFILVFIGALTCGAHIMKQTKSKRRRRVRRRPLPQPQLDGDLPAMPKLPNYFDTDVSVLPPYLGFNEGTNVDGNRELPPPYEQEPPPYSITAVAETSGVDTTVEQITPSSTA